MRSTPVLLLILAWTAVAPPVARSQSIWQPTATGTYNWDLAANWSGGVPDGATANASFTALLTGNQTINLVANRTLNILTIGSSGGTYTLAGTQVLTLGGTTPTVTMVANSQNVFLNMNTLALGAAATITNNSTVGTLNIGVAGTSTIANGTNGLTLDGPGAITVNSVFTGTTGAITKNGTGVVTFTDLNAFGTPNTATAYGTVTTGNITVNGGGIIVGNLRLTAPGMNPNRTPGGTVVPRTLIIANGAFAQVNGTLSIDPSSSTYVTLVSGAGTLRLRNGTSTLANPSLTADHGPSGGDADPWGSVIATPVDIGAGTHWFVGKTNRNDVSRYAGDLRFDGPFTGTGNIQVRGTNNNNNRNWQLVFNANNSGYTGSVFIANTSLHLTNVSALTAANAVTFNTVVDANTQNQGGIFLWGRNLTIGSLNDTSEATTSNFIRNGARDLANGGTNANNNAATNGVALGVNADSILTVTQTTDGTFGGIISDGPNDNGTGDTGTYRTLGITKAGTATLTLTGANTFTGPLTVVNGVLVLNGANATANTTVNGGTLRIGASGSLPNGPVVMGSGGVFDVTATGFTFNTGRTFTVGRSGTAANDVLGSVTVAGTLNIGPANEARTATFANNLTLNGANVGFSLGTATTIGSGVNDLVVVGGNLTLTGTNNIVITQLGGSLASGTYTLFQYTGTVTGGAANLALSGVTTGTTRQTFTFNTTAASNGAVTLAVAGNPANLTWVGNAASNVWDLVTTVNWTGAPGATPDNRFYNLDTVLFNDTGVGGATNVTLTGTLAPGSITVNATQNYTFAGTGTLAGNTGLTKQGTGTLTLLTNNTYSGGTTVSAGVLNVGNGGTTGTITGALTNNASVVFNRSDALTFAGVISGNGTITKSGTGALTLSGTNTYTGTTTVTAGTLVISSDASLGAAPAALVANQLTLASGTTLQASAGFTMAANRGIALGGPVTIDTQANTVVINGPMSGAGAALTKIGTGSLTLVGANTYTGGTNLNAGALGFETGASLGTGTITVAAGVTNQASITSTPGAPFLFHTATADVTLANNIVLPAPTSDTTYTFVKQSSGGQINFTGVISGGNAATKLFLNSTTGGDNTTTYRFAGNNTFRASIELWRGGIVVGSATGLGDAANFIRLNGNNNTTLGDLRFDFSGTVANQFEIVDGGGGGIGVIGTNSVTLSGTILGTGTGTPLRKVGTGTLTLTGANTYVGATLVDAGTLLVNGNHAGATGAVTVAPGATLGGTGTIATAVTVNGAANNPGLLRGGNAAGAGTLTLTNGLTLTANSGINYRITGGNPSTTAGGSSVGTAPNFTSNNYVNVTGGTLTVAAGDIPTLRFIIDGTGTTFTMNQAYSYRVAQVAGQDLSGVQLTGATFQGQFSTVGFQAINFSLTGDTAGILYLGFTPVPEPGTILGIGTVVMGIGAWVRKRRQQT